MTRMHRWRATLACVRAVSGLAAALGVGWAVHQAAGQVEATVLPPWERLAIAFGISIFAILAASASWPALIGWNRWREAVAGHLLAQLARYIPGSIWQGVSQVSAAVRLGILPEKALIAFVVQMASQVAAAALIALGIMQVHAYFLWYWAPVAILVGLLLTRMCWVVALRIANQLLDRNKFSSLHLPSQQNQIWAVGLSAISVVGQGAMFWILLPVEDYASSSQSTLIFAIAAFAASLAFGFMVFLAPAGLGAREAALVVFLGNEFGAAAVLSASVAHRLVALTGEVAALGLVIVARKFLKTG